MYCSNCDNPKPLKAKKIVHQYKESGLDNFVLKGVSESKCPKCAEVYYNFGDMDQLHGAIVDLLLSKEGLLTGKEVRFLRSSIGYSGAYFSRVLGYEPETISRIETGKSPVTKAFDRHVRESVFNKVPDRDYDLHERILNPIKIPKTVYLDLKKSGWALVSSHA